MECLLLGFQSSVPNFEQLCWDRHLACHLLVDRQDAGPNNTMVSDPLSSSPVQEDLPELRIEPLSLSERSILMRVENGGGSRIAPYWMPAFVAMTEGLVYLLVY